MVHLRIVVPADRCDAVCDLLDGLGSVINVVRLRGVATRPDGDLVLCDVAREDASVVLADLRALRIDRDGSIAVSEIDTFLGDDGERAIEIAPGAVADAVIWEQVEAQAAETAELSAAFVLFMVLAGLIASVGIYLDSAILIVGAMVVGPEFGPLAGVCVAAVQRRGGLALRSVRGLLLGFAAAILAVTLASLVFKATGATPDEFTDADHSLSDVIASPDFFAFFVAFCAGVAGMLSLATAKSAALIGVFISVTTIPAAANIGVAAAYGEWDTASGSAQQLGINLASILVAGVLTLAAQRALYQRRRRRHQAGVTRRT